MGSPPLHSSSSPSSWLQWTTTSSPTFQRLTLEPTAQTIRTRRNRRCDRGSCGRRGSKRARRAPPRRRCNSPWPPSPKPARRGCEGPSRHDLDLHGLFRRPMPVLAQDPGVHRRRHVTDANPADFVEILFGAAAGDRRPWGEYSWLAQGPAFRLRTGIGLSIATHNQPLRLKA